MDFGAFHYAPPLAWPAFAIGQLPFATSAEHDGAHTGRRVPAPH
jgi:hypothetical protein